MSGVANLRTSPKTLSVCGVAAERRGTVAEYAGVAADRAGNVAEHTSVFGDVAHERDDSGRRKCGTTRWCRRGETTRWRKWAGDPRGWRGIGGGLGSILKRSSDKCRIRHNFDITPTHCSDWCKENKQGRQRHVYHNFVHGRDPMECERTQFEGGLHWIENNT